MRASPKIRRAHEAGFTVVEGLIAALLLAIILVGILPLIDRAKQNNLQGNDATYESNAIVDRLESLYSLPFNHPDLNLAIGELDLEDTDWFLQSSRTWSDTAPSLSTDARYTRSSIVEYFGGADLNEDIESGLVGTFDSPIAGTDLTLEANKNAIQFKRIQLEISKQRVFDTSPYRVVAVKAY